LLSLGFPPINFGEAITSLAMLPLPQSQRRPDGSLMGHVLHIDNFGNLITDIKSSDLPPAKEELIMVEIGGHVISGLSRTYGEGRGLLALIGSSDYLEIALKGGNASAFLDAEVGSEVRLKQLSGGNSELSRL
jgi:S-adenosylmethionine hydrolase